MICRSCGGESMVVRTNAPDPTPNAKYQLIRVRQCVKCHQRWRTIECRESEASFVEAFKYVQNRKRAPA